METYATLVKAIVKHQESVVGPLAWSEAQKVSGIKISDKNVAVSGDGEKVLGNLVRQYEHLFGRASVEACKDAVRPYLPKMKDIKLPSNLL